MKILLELPKQQRARVWIGELPDAHYPSLHTASHTVEARGAHRGGPLSAAIELYVPRGPRWMYGLLGGHWKPAQPGELRIVAETSKPSGRPFADHLAISSEHVRVGFPAEYSRALAAGVHLAQSALEELPSGHLAINAAAHGAVGSCEMVYKHIVAVLIKLFSGERKQPSDDEVLALFPSLFN